MAVKTTKNINPTKGTTCQMPDLGHLSAKVSLTYMLNRYFVGRGPKNPVSHARMVNFIRIVDAVLGDYGNMRLQLHQYLSTPNDTISPLFLAINYSEACVANLHRAARLADAIRRDQHGPQIEKHDLLSTLATATIRKFRDEIQHLDEKLTNGQWKPPESLCIALADDRLELYGKVILYRDLAGWITKLHAVSQNLAQYKEP